MQGITVPAVNHDRASIRWRRSFNPSYKSQQSSGVIGHPVFRPGCEVELTHLMLGRVSSLLTETQCTLVVQGKNKNHWHSNASNSLQALISQKICYKLFRDFLPSVIDVTNFFGSEWGHPGHYLRGVLGLLGQLGLWAPHVRSSCNLTDVQKGITKALGSSRRGSSFLFSSGRLLQSRPNFFFHTEMTK